MRTLTKSLAIVSLSCRGDGLDEEAEDTGYSAENQDNPLRMVVNARRDGYRHVHALKKTWCGHARYFHGHIWSRVRSRRGV